MPNIQTDKKHNKYFGNLFLLAIPVLLGELGHILTGAVDVAVISRYSTSALASVSIANSLLYTIFIFGLGIQNAISIILSAKRGQKQDIGQYFSCIFFYSILLSLFFTLLCLLIVPVCDVVGFKEKLVPDIKTYIYIVAFSMPGLFIFQGIKEFLQSMEKVNVPNVILLLSVVLNFILNIWFVFGFAFIPESGVPGAAFATVVVRYLIAAAVFIYAVRQFKLKPDFNFKLMYELTKTGFPIGAAWMLEFLAFNIITILVGRISGVLSAVHGILTTISSVTFAFPASIAIALCIKTAYHFGAGEPCEIKKYLITALQAGVGFMMLASAIIFLFPGKIMSIFSGDTEVIKAALPVISILGLYQIFDGFQTVTGGLLKGFQKTGIVSSSVIASYWLIGAPIAYVLTSVFNMSLSGYWFALAFSLFSMSVIQTAAGIYEYRKFDKKIKSMF